MGLRKIGLPIHGIVIEYDPDNTGCGTIDCDPGLYGVCSACGKRDCPDNRDGVSENNAAVDAIMSMILGHACAGIDVTDEAYLHGIETAFDAVTNFV